MLIARYLPNTKFSSKPGIVPHIHTYDAGFKFMFPALTRGRLLRPLWQLHGRTGHCQSCHRRRQASSPAQAHGLFSPNTELGIPAVYAHPQISRTHFPLSDYLSSNPHCPPCPIRVPFTQGLGSVHRSARVAPRGRALIALPPESPFDICACTAAPGPNCAPEGRTQGKSRELSTTLQLNHAASFRSLAQCRAAWHLLPGRRLHAPRKDGNVARAVHVSP